MHRMQGYTWVSALGLVAAAAIAGATSNTHWRNNLFLGENAAPAIFAVTTFTNYTSSDYNGFRPNRGATAAFRWNSPPREVLADFTGPGHTARLETRSSATLAECALERGQSSPIYGPRPREAK
jgi:hypothetical protein